MIYLYITRHGMTSWNELGKLQGHRDSPLTQQGKKDAACLRTVMKDYPIDKVFSSPLPRAYDTAKLIFPNYEITKDERLKEMNFGEAEGQKIECLLENTAYHLMWNHPERFERFKNGESYQEVIHRLYNFLNELEHDYDGKHVFITIHGMLYVVLMSIFKQLSLKELPTINRQIVRGGSLTIVTLDHHHYQILIEGDSTHLEPIEKTSNFIKK